MTRRGRRRLALLAALLVLIAAGAVGGYSLLKWRRAQAIVSARTSGLEAYSEGRHADVLEILGPHVRSLDEDAEVLRALADSRRLEELPDGGHLKGAAALYRRVADLEREDLESRLALLEVLPDLGLLPETIIASEEVLEIDPLNREALEARARAFAAMGRWDEAVQLAAQLIELDPEDGRWRQLQVSAAYAAGLESDEVVELVDQWPATPGSAGLDRAIRGAILIQSGNVEAANELFEQAAAAGAADESSLEDMVGILGDARRTDLALEVLERYEEVPGFSGAAAVVAADWAMRQGEREWLAAMLDTASLTEDVAAVFASRLAIFELLGGTERLDERLALVRGHLSQLGEASAAEGLRQLADGAAMLESEDDEFDSYLEQLDRRSVFQTTLATVLCQILKRPDVSEWMEAASVLPPSLIVSALEVRQLESQGRRVEAIRTAIELASAFRTRGEPVVLLATLWATTPGLPPDIEAQLSELAQGADAFEFISKLCEDRGYDRTTAVPYISAAIAAEAWLEVEQAVGLVLETLDGDVPLLVEIHDLLAADAPELADRVLVALRSAAPGDPRVLALTWTPGDAAGVDLGTRRRDLPLDSEDPEERRLAWIVLLGNVADVDENDYLDLAREAVAANPDAPSILAKVANDVRAWGDTGFVRSVIDRFAETSPDSIDLDLLEARWALRTEVPDEVFDATLARLDDRYLGGNRSIAVATTMLEMLLSRDDASPEAIVRLGRQILQDHPEAVEIYPVLISVMQDAGMLADADLMLREFESIDRRGVLSGRQRVVQSLRTGDFESLASTMANVAEASGEIDDLYRLALARQATGDVGDAERLHRRVLQAGSEAFGALSARALADILFESGRGDEIGPALAPFADALPAGLVEILALTSAQRGDAVQLTQLAEVVSRHPEHVEGWLVLSEGHLASGNLADSVRVARDGLREHPDSAALGRLLIGAGLVDPGRLPELVEDVGVLPGAAGAALALLAESCNGGDRLAPDARQVRASRDLCGRFPDDLIAWSTAMAIHEAAGQLAECRALADAAGRRFPDAAEPAEWRVRVATSLGQIEEAIAASRAWRALSFPNVRRVDETRAALELARGRGDAAASVLAPHREAIVAVRAERPGPYRALLASMLMTGDVRGARRLEGDRLSSGVSERATWARLATMAPYRFGLEAMSLLEAATPPDPTSRVILVGQWLDFHRRHPDGDGLARARQLVPETAPPPRDAESRLQNLATADIARAVGDVRKQMDTLRTVIGSYEEGTMEEIAELPADRRAMRVGEIEPLIFAMNNLAMALLEQQQDLEEAERLVARCLDVLPGQPDLRDTHAQILMKLGRMSEAERSSAIALQGDLDNAAILATAAEILGSTGRFEEARLVLQRIRDAMRSDPWPDRELEARIDGVEAMVSGGP